MKILTFFHPSEVPKGFKVKKKRKNRQFLPAEASPKGVLRSKRDENIGNFPSEAGRKGVKVEKRFLKNRHCPPRRKSVPKGL